MNTSSHPITIDNVRLDTWAWNITTKEGWDLGLAVVGTDEPVPGRHGEIWTPNKKFGAGRFIVEMWVRGSLANGMPPSHGDAYAQYRENLDKLRLLFGVRHRLLDVRQDLGPLGVRRAYCEVRGAVDPKMVASARGTFSVLFQNPGAFWEDVDLIAHDSGIGVTTGTRHVTEFAGGSAPILDSELVFDGPWTTPYIIDPATGHKLQLSSNVPAGQQWYVNCKKRTSRVGTNIAWSDSGGTDVYLNTSKVGPHAPALFGFTPEFENFPTVTLGGGGLNTTSRFRMRGRRKFQ